MAFEIDFDLGLIKRDPERHWCMIMFIITPSAVKYSWPFFNDAI